MLNTKPVFTGIPVVKTFRFSSGQGVVGNNFTTVSNWLNVFTARTLYGSYVKKIRVKFVGGDSMSLPPTTDNVLRVAFQDGNDPNTLSLIDELYLPRVSLSATSTGPSFELPLNLTLGSDDKLYMGITKTPTGSSIDVTIIGGDFSK